MQRGTTLNVSGCGRRSPPPPPPTATTARTTVRCRREHCRSRLGKRRQAGRQAAGCGWVAKGEAGRAAKKRRGRAGGGGPGDVAGVGEDGGRGKRGNKLGFSVDICVYMLWQGNYAGPIKKLKVLFTKVP